MAIRVIDQQYYALLASRIREGDSDAFTELYNATYDSLHNSVRCFLHNQEDVYDAMQEIYISVFKNIGSLRIDRLLIPWMRQITYHTCCGILRQNKTRQEMSVSLDDQQQFLNTPPSAGDPFGQVHEMDDWSWVNQVLQNRPFRERQAFLLRYENGLKLEEIATFMGVSLSSVKRYIKAARTELQEQWNPET